MTDAGAWERLRYRRSRHLVAYWDGHDFLLQNYATGATARADPDVCEILDFFCHWRSGRQLLRNVRNEDESVLAATVGLLVDLTFLYRSDRRHSEHEAAMRTLSAWNPHAGFFHTSTKNVTYIGPLEGNRILRLKARSSPLPAPVKTHPGARRVSLPSPARKGELPSVLLARRTWRAFSRASLDLPALGTLLGLTAGIQNWVTLPGQGDLALKTSPSGGARHPIEIYVAARRVQGVSPGLYHYRGDTHQLEELSRRKNIDVTAYLPAQRWFRGAGAVIFFAAVFERMLWKYSYARAYRAAFIETGHLCQTFCLVATWLGLAPFCSMALADSRIERDLRLDGISESVLYCAGVGTRPAGVDRAMMPSGRRPLVIRPNRNMGA